MPLTPGDKIGPYEILSPLGTGGMGEVYRARDPKLNREVAIKVLPSSLANDADYLTRFQREAQSLAALNHPNIATIFGLEQNAIVMELIEGQTLQGPLPLAQTLPIAKQIAEALEAAHDKGIIHRDLKPANIKLTPEGIVKVLDFGLAKAIEKSATPTSADSPTLTVRATQAGLILGTAGYMSPEQAAGKPVDRRADIWSFGVVLWELITGKRLFNGETVSHTLADVIKGDIDFNEIPAGPIRDLIRRCLDRNIKNRLQHIGEARIAIDNYQVNPTVPVPPPYPRYANWLLAALLIAITATGTWYLTRKPSVASEQPFVRLNIDLGPDAWPYSRFNYGAPFAISKDGNRIAFLVRGAGSKPVLATRTLDQEQMTILSGTENAVTPFFSPDGQFIAFAADGQLKKVPVGGGGVTVICDASVLRGASWGENGDIVAALDNHSALAIVPAMGGTPTQLTSLTQDEKTHRWPQMLPGGKDVLFMAGIAGLYDNATIEVQSIETGKRKLLHRGGYFPRYLKSGHLIFMKQEVLYAAPMDLKRMELTAPPVPVLRDISVFPAGGGVNLDVASNGTLLYRSTDHAEQHSLSWMSESGNVEPFVAQPGRYQSFRLSPDGKRLAVSIKGSGLFVYDSGRNSLSRLVADSSLADKLPIWTPSGNEIIYRGEKGLNCVRADGSAQPQQWTQSPNDLPGGLLPDVLRLFFTRGSDNWTLPVDWKDASHPRAGKAEQSQIKYTSSAPGRISPDGKWLAYMAIIPGGLEVLVRPTASASGDPGVWQISSDGGELPVWSPNGKELLYLNRDRSVVAVSYTSSSGAFVVGKSRFWTGGATIVSQDGPFDISLDGKRLLLQSRPGTLRTSTDSSKMVMLFNFFDELKRRVPTNH